MKCIKPPTDVTDVELRAMRHRKPARIGHMAAFGQYLRIVFYE